MEEDTKASSHGSHCACGAWRGSLGLEPTPELYIEHMVIIFREVMRVLRRDGTLWLNMGDSYASGKGTCFNPGVGFNSFTGVKSNKDAQVYPLNRGNISELRTSGLKPKDLVGMPWRLAFALQADGWWLRSDIIWSKPNPMPESVQDRPTKAHEYIFLLSKSKKYYYDLDAVRTDYTEGTFLRLNQSTFDDQTEGPKDGLNPNRSCTKTLHNLKKRLPSGWMSGPGSHTDLKGRYTGEKFFGHSRDNSAGIQDDLTKEEQQANGANLRTVWDIATQPFPGAHFATFPEEIPLRCIKAGTSEKGCCPKCGKPWRRVTERNSNYALRKAAGSEYNKNGDYQRSKITSRSHPLGDFHDLGANVETVGWAAACGCEAGEPVPAVVSDPFCGSGTTGVVALHLDRSFIGIELNPEYVAMAERRIVDVEPLFRAKIK